MGSESDIERILYTESDISKRVSDLAAEISADLSSSGGSTVFVGVATGAFLLIADLVRRISAPITIDFIRVESYGSGTESCGEPRISCDLKLDVTGKHVVLVLILPPAIRILKLIFVYIIIGDAVACR